MDKQGRDSYAQGIVQVKRPINTAR